MDELPSSIQAEEHQDPKWGVFPVEQYLIRLKLVRAFTQTEDLRDEGDASAAPASRSPTHDEIRDILEPWRAQKLRRIAYAMRTHASVTRKDQLVILRTYYGEGSDELMAAVLEEEADWDWDESTSPEDRWWHVLDDAELFGHLEDDWSPVLDILPELAGHTLLNAPRRRLPTREEAAEMVEDEYEWTVDPLGELHGSIATRWPLLVADQEALEDQALLCLFLDDFGNVVRQSFLKPEEFPRFKGAYQRGSVSTQPYWEMSGDSWRVKVGPKYKPDGEIGSRIYPSHVVDNAFYWVPPRN